MVPCPSSEVRPWISPKLAVMRLVLEKIGDKVFTMNQLQDGLFKYVRGRLNVSLKPLAAMTSLSLFIWRKAV